MWTLITLPREVLLHCFGYLKETDLARLMRVCRGSHNVAQDERLWRAAFLAEWPGMSSQVVGNSWRRQAVRMILSNEGWLRGSYRHCTVDGKGLFAVNKDVFVCEHPQRPSAYLVYDAKSGTVTRTLQLRWPRKIASIRLSDTRLIASAMAPAAAVLGVWDSQKGGDPLYDLQHEHAVSAFTVSATTIAAGLESGDVCLWDVESGTPLRTLPAHCSKISALALHASGALAVCNAAGGLAVWRDVRDDGMFRLPLNKAASVVWSTSGRELAVGLLRPESALVLVDVEIGRVVQRFPAGVPLYLDSAKLVFRRSAVKRNEIVVLNRSTMKQLILPVNGWSCAVASCWLYEAQVGRKFRVLSFHGMEEQAFAGPGFLSKRRRLI